MREECLATAMANPDLAGLWGGTSELERKQLRRATGGVRAQLATAVSCACG